MSKLHLLSGNDVVASIELTGDLITIGRTEQTELCIEDNSISKSHGILVRDGDDYQIHDFNSTNGTWVNGERILAVKLKHGDRVRIGHVDVLYDSAPAPVAPPIKLGLGAKRLEATPAVLPLPSALPPSDPISTSVPPAEPAKPVRRTLGGKLSGAVSETVAAPAPIKKESQPVPSKNKTEDRVFINIPDHPTVAAPEPSKSGIRDKLRTFVSVPPSTSTQSEPVLNKPLPPKPTLAPVLPPPSESEPTPEPVNLAEYEVVPQAEEPAPVEAQDTQPAPPEALSEAPAPVEMALGTSPTTTAVDKKLQSTKTFPKGEVRLHQAPAGSGGEKKLSMRPAAQAPRDKLRFGPAKKS